eukprot:SAG31_NODE_36017_length_317_cov_0.935780_1_plen_61_part_10
MCLYSQVMEQASEPASASAPVATDASGARTLSHTDLDFHPNRVEIVTARVDGDIQNPAYIM